MHCIVLGAAAGGGFPQWNCACPNCARARAGDAAARPRTQAGIAASADGVAWALIGASPDLRQQILAAPRLAPAPGTRLSPVVSVVLISADIDGIAGLLVLREQHAFRIFAPAAILAVLRANGVFGVLDPALVGLVEVAPGVAVEVAPGLEARLLALPGKVPLYQEDRGAAVAEAAPSYAAALAAGGRRAIVAPGCAEITDAVLEQLRGADVLFFDGTVFEDDEMIRAGLGRKTGRRMGHVPVAGEGGSLARLAGLPGRRIYFHINNSNPILLDDSPERRAVEQAGFEVSWDGMEVEL